MTATQTTTERQTVKPRLEDKNYKLRGTTKLEVGNYTFIVYSYRPVYTRLTTQDSLLPIITQRVNHSLAKQNISMLPSSPQTPCGHGAERRR